MSITRLTDDNLAAMLAEPTAILYKHSPTCTVSMTAHGEIDRFVAAHDDVPIYLVDVLAQRSLSQQLEADLGILHESPQAILLRQGEPVWNDSHFRVTQANLEAALESA